MCPTNYYTFDPNFSWNSPARVTAGDALQLLGVLFRDPIDTEEVEYLIEKGFSFDALHQLEQVIYVGEPLLWDDLIEPNFSARLADPNRLSALESARAYNLALCWLLVLQAFRSDGRAQTFLLRDNDLPPEMTAIVCTLEGGCKRRLLMESLRLRAKYDWIEPQWYPFED